MEYRELGRSGVKVSAICLGTMTFGEQNTEADGHAQMDYALDRGITMFDAAEIYPVPPKPETQGRTEAIIGSWLSSRKARDKVLLATKAIGRTKMNWLRKDGSPGRQSRAQLIEALHGSLKRLNTDHIDLYQLHWPDRPMRIFEGLDYVHKEGESHSIEDILGVLGDFVKQGKVRFVGLSNETPWGVMSFLKAAENLSLPRIVSIQNAYNLVNRSFETGLAEIFYREQVSLLAYSPLGQGYLTGKYEGGALPARLAQEAVRPSGPLRDGQWPPRHLGLCCARAKAWPRPCANGACLHRFAAFRHVNHHWRDDSRPVKNRY